MNALVDALSQILSGAGYVLDTPGALTRGVLSGRPGERASGREMLESWGMLGPNQEGLDLGDVAGFGADLVVDPLNLLGAGMVKRTLGIADDAMASNRLRQQMMNANPFGNGAMPEEIARLTKAVDEAGNPIRTYRGAHGNMPTIREELFGNTHASYTSPDMASDLSGYKAYATNLDELAYEQSRNEGLHDIVQRNLAWAVPDRERQVAELMNRQYFDTLQGRPAGMDLFDRDVLPDFPEMMMEPKNYTMDGIKQLRQSDAELLKRQWMSRQLANPRVEMSYLDIRNPKMLDYGDTSGIPSDLSTLSDVLPELGYDGVVRQTGRGMEYNVFDPSQVYQPYIAPALRPVPRVSPLLAALGGSNLVQGFSGQ